MSRVKLIRAARAANSRKKPSATQTRLDRCVTWFDLLAKIGLIIAVIYGIREYNSAVADKQREFSFSMIEDWESGDYLDEFSSVAVLIDDLRAKFPTKYNGFPKQKELETSFVAGELLKEISNDRDLEKRVRNLYYFYSKTGVCALEKICDAKLISAFLGSGAEDFLSYFHPYAQRVRNSGQTQFGLYAELFYLE